MRRGVLGDRRLVQGQWGGSILDSVVGVFLTQNVSDALSSKAWMSLASTFPLPASQQDGIDSMDWEAVRTAPVEQVRLRQSAICIDCCKGSCQMDSCRLWLGMKRFAEGQC